MHLLLLLLLLPRPNRLSSQRTNVLGSTFGQGTRTTYGAAAPSPPNADSSSGTHTQPTMKTGPPPPPPPPPARAGRMCRGAAHHVSSLQPAFSTAEELSTEPVASATHPHFIFSLFFLFLSCFYALLLLLLCLEFRWARFDSFT